MLTRCFTVRAVIPSLVVQHFFILFEVLRSLFADVDSGKITRIYAICTLDANFDFLSHIKRSCPQPNVYVGKQMYEAVPSCWIKSSKRLLWGP
jgi:hypothetical protein